MEINIVVLETRMTFYIRRYTPDTLPEQVKNKGRKLLICRNSAFGNMPGLSRQIQSKNTLFLLRFTVALHPPISTRVPEKTWTVMRN